MVPAKRHKENKNIEINTPLKLLVLQQEVQMFHWWFLHYKLPTVKYKVVMSICTMETPHTAGLSLTPDHKSVPHLGVAHHGDKEALCHRAQDEEMAAGRLKAPKQPGVSGSLNAGRKNSTTCRLVSERNQDTVHSQTSSYLFKERAIPPVLHTVLRKTSSFHKVLRKSSIFWRESPPEIGQTKVQQTESVVIGLAAVV